jgi:hypothetical protein
VGVASLLLIAAGAVLVAIAGLRVREPYRRYMALRTQERNLARYDSWRGGHHGAAEKRPSSAELMQAELRRQAQRWMAVGVCGFVLIFAGFMVR